MDGRVAKIAKTMALLEQPYIKDSAKTVQGARPLAAAAWQRCSGGNQVAQHRTLRREEFGWRLRGTWLTAPPPPCPAAPRAPQR